MSTSCTTCPAGYSCSSTSTAPFRCAVGTYQSSTGQTSCNTCSAGSKCLNPAVAPVTCETNHTSIAGQIACQPCPAGYSCPDTNTANNVACASGEYSLEGQAGCTACPAGNYCPNKDYYYRCLEGYYSTGSQASCTACEVGYYCTLGARYICPFLTYADSTGMAECREVPTNYIISSFNAGTSSNMTGGTGITKCTANQYTDDMHWTCTDCDDTHMCTQEQNVIPCPYGHAKLNGYWYCTPCPPGSICEYSGGSMVVTSIDDYVTNIGKHLRRNIK